MLAGCTCTEQGAGGENVTYSLLDGECVQSPVMGSLKRRVLWVASLQGNALLFTKTHPTQPITHTPSHCGSMRDCLLLSFYILLRDCAAADFSLMRQNTPFYLQRLPPLLQPPFHTPLLCSNFSIAKTFA